MCVESQSMFATLNYRHRDVGLIMIALVLGVKYLIIVNENDVSMTTK